MSLKAMITSRIIPHAAPTVSPYLPKPPFEASRNLSALIGRQDRFLLTRQSCRSLVGLQALFSRVHDRAFSSNARTAAPNAILSDNIIGSAHAEPPNPTKVAAIYLSRKIDVFGMYERLKIGRLLMDDEYLIVPIHRTSTIFSAAPQGATAGTSIKRRERTQRSGQGSDPLVKDDDADPSSKYCVFFSHGAVVFFDCDEKTQTACLEQAKMFSKVSPLEPMQREEFELQTDRNLAQSSLFVPNGLNLRSLNIKSVAVISSVLGQAVALRHFEEEIDTLLEDFEKREFEAIRILRESSKVLRDVILNLGLLDHASGSNPAWEEEEYHQIWAGLRDEFEIEKRWKVLQTKTSFLQDNLRFAVELSHAQTSERLEIAIIALISAELFISVYHLLG